MKKPLRQNVFSYAYLAGQNVLLKVRNTSAINMGPIRYDTLNSLFQILGPWFEMTNFCFV